MSHAYHGLFRERMARGAWRDKPRPIVINNWEATYFDFDEARLLAIAAAGRELGIELFVLDDGWFGRRDDDTTSLGDWQVNRRKLPGGLESLARKVEDLGMRFGLWIEPEMISRASELFADHADWAVGIPARPQNGGPQPVRPGHVAARGRGLPLRRAVGVLGSAPISYVKWDMNRNITEPFTPSLPPWRQGEFMHRYILGVYALYDRLTKAFPGILFESCAGGGGQVRPGHAGLRAAGLDQRRHRRDRAAEDPVGHLDGIPAQLDGGPRVGGAEPPGRPHDAPGDPRRGGLLRRLRLRAGPDQADRRGASLHRRTGRLLQAVARGDPVRPLPPAAQPVRGRRQRDRLDGRWATIGRPPSSATTRCSTEPTSGRGGCAFAAWIRRRSTASPSGRARPSPTPSRATMLGGDVLMAAGLVIEARRTATRWATSSPPCTSWRRVDSAEQDGADQRADPVVATA